MNENFYLACENTDIEHPFSIFRISNIQEIKLNTKTFHLNPDIESFIKELQTPFPKYTPNYRTHMIEVLVEVDSKKARFFKLKKFLPSQEELVKKWIPYMRVIEPLSLKEKIEGDLKQYLEL